MKRIFQKPVVFLLAFWLAVNCFGQSPLYSIETDYTISNVRNATDAGGKYIIANSYEGTILAIDYDGTIRWENKLSGFMNHDVWCDDLTGDGVDEIVTANADGNIYCLDNSGNLMWQFKNNDVPMFSTCVISKGNSKYVVASSLDLSIYYLSSDGNLVKEIPSSSYSQENTWGDNAPPDNIHLANFVRKINKSNGEEALLIHGTVNTNSTNGSIYLFDVLADAPYKIIDPMNAKPVGDVRVSNYFGDGKEKIFMGSSTSKNDTDLSVYTQNTQQSVHVDYSQIINDLGGFGYRVVQTEIIPDGNSYQYFSLIGNSIALTAPNLNLNNTEKLLCKYSFNDLWHDHTNKRMILASSQSGGNAIHVIDYTNPNWKTAYRNLDPPGNIQVILDNTQAVRDNLENYTAPSWQRAQKSVWFVSDLNNRNNNNSAYVRNLAQDINTNYSSPILMASVNLPNVQDPNDWNRDTMSNVFYRDRRDGRKNYIRTQSQVLDEILPEYADEVGLSYWGGHGNDPYMFSLKTKKALLDGANGKKTVLIYPELQNDTEDFKYVMNNLMYPLATYARQRNAQIHIRTKHTFWQGAAYGPNWTRMETGEFADIFVPTMEQTGDKSMELSIAARMGYWLGGSVNQWGGRAVPDNASYYRLRQFSHQKLPNHHLRQVIYQAASGATHFNNFRVDVDYTSLVWELIAKGALFVPERHEILSLSPVHLSMKNEPDPYYLNEGANVKWVTFYDESQERNNKLVFSRLNGSWPGAPVTDWDFSKYAAGEKERRLNHIPRYNNGLVIITPVQSGALATNNVPRGKLSDKLHPFYKDVMTEYITDGRDYISKNGNQTFPAETFYQTIKQEIEEKANLLPVTVSGDVGWVVAQTDSMHLRLTLVDGGWLNPSKKEVTVRLNVPNPKSMTDILDGKSFDLSDPTAVTVDVPSGMFRFIDIELSEPIEIYTDTAEVEPDTIGMSVFPNPTNDFLNIKFTATEAESDFRVTDNLGKVLIEKTFSTFPNLESTVEIDVSKLAEGNYFVQWIDGERTERFIKTE